MAQEFLPLCDVLFNIISLAAYFCDIVFDLVTVYTLYATKQTEWFIITLVFIMTSLISCQIVSFKWHKRRENSSKNCFIFILTLHTFQCGVLWRYFKLFIPVDLRHVKLDVRDLCILRMVHAFCESIPMLMIQLYLIWNRDNLFQITRLNILSTILSLLNVCWALASFNKYIRKKNVHKLVLTWLGVVSQLLWRIGTVSSRVVVLTVYATLYHHWTLLVIFLHWLTMFLWLISPRNIFRGEKISFYKKYLLSTVIGFIYVFCYINLQESNAWRKVVIFYTTMCLENSLLMAVWLMHRPHSTWFEIPAMIIVWGGFVFGILSMIVYYQCFHLRRMKYDPWANRSLQDVNGFGQSSLTNDTEAAIKDADKKFVKKPTIPREINDVRYVPGVFNCRLNPGLKRKKKKPTTFVPPPPVPSLSLSGKMDCPFWKRTVVKSASSDQDGSSVGSRVNIQQKLQEKKQQQLQELKEIEEEIKQGKIKRPKLLEMSRDRNGLKLIPRSKKRPVVNRRTDKMCRSKYRAKTPEIFLSPQYLENYHTYYDYNECPYKCRHVCYNPSEVSSSNFSLSGANQKEKSYLMYKSYRIPSDLDSQISLPRSYTLPREFRYYRKSRNRKPVRSEHFVVTSTNSSDGDVDSGDEVDDGGFLDAPPCHVWPSYRLNNCHETKL